MTSSNDKMFSIRRLAIALMVSVSLVSCGGGGGGGGSQTPSTTASGVVGFSGGSITSSNGTIVTIDSNVVQDGTLITVTITTPPPSTSPEITPASAQISVEIPANALSATNTSVDSGISINIPLTDLTAGVVSAQEAGRAAPIKTSYRYIQAQIGTTISYGKYVTKVVSNKVVATTKIAYQNVKQQVTQGNPGLITFLVNTFSPNVPTAGTLFEVTGTGPNDYVDSLIPKTVVPNGKLPLVLVHGIQLGCDGNAEAYKTTWDEFRKFFFSNLGQSLRDKYQLYTFSYQTDLSIKENGRLLANVLKVSFGSRPSVVLAHSMGGLVTRSAMIHHEAIGANISGLITLGTPHHGTKTVNSVAALVDHTCFFATDAQGAKDMSWDHFDDPAYNPNTMPSINSFLVGADGINTLETAYAQNHSGYYQRLLPYAGTIISPAQTIDLPQCPNLIEKILLKGLVLPPGIVRTPLYICSAADVMDYLATWDEVVPEASARYKDYVSGTYLDKPSWSLLPRTYTGIVHSSSFGLSSLFDSPWVFLENPDTTAGGIRTDLLNLYVGTPLPFDTSNGSCGSSNGATVLSAPSTNLCSTGTSSAVSGSGPWNWSCSGSNGGTNASCSALKLTTSTNGTCGSSNGATVSSAPASNLCLSGTSSTVLGSGPWNWSCSGSNGGTNASCSATPTAATTIIFSSISPSVITQGSSYTNVTFIGSGFTATSWPHFSTSLGASQFAISAPTINSSTSMTVAVSNTTVQTITWMVCAANGSSTCSNTQTVSVQAAALPAPAAPSGLAALPASNFMSLAWNDNSSNETGFYVERKTGVSGSWSQTASVGQNVGAYLDFGVTAGVTYYYRVAAYNAFGISGYTNEAFVTIPTISAPAVQSLAATLVTSSTAQMNGSINPNGQSTSAYFEYGTTTSYGGSTGPGTFSGTSAISIQSGWSGLTPNTTYHYRAVATNSGGTSIGGDVSFTTSAAPLVVNGVPSSYAATSGTYQPSNYLSGSGFSSMTQVYLTCSRNGTTCGNYTWTSANWSGKFIVINDTTAVFAPVLTVSTDPAGTYNWSVTFTSGGQSVTRYFTVIK